MKKIFLVFFLLSVLALIGFIVVSADDLSYDGIYKDIGGSYNLNVFVQSYDNGGTLLIYTFDTDKMYAFWDSEVESDLFNSSDPINPKDSNLTVHFDFKNMILYIIDATTGITNTYRCYKYANAVSGGIPSTTTTVEGPTTTSIGPSSTTTTIPGQTENMVYVPAGEFLMGSDIGRADEKPVRHVYLDAFYIDKYEVTNKEFAEFLNANGNQEEGGALWYNLNHVHSRIYYDEQDQKYKVFGGYENHPVNLVTWYGAKAYCEWKGKRLPTEAEWEKAARGTDGRTYPWGFDDPTCDIVRYFPCGYGTVRVDNFANGQSPYGAIQMAGNVSEWVNDWYDREYYKLGINENPQGPETGTRKAFRGGSYWADSDELRVSYRYVGNPDACWDDVGFRCALCGQ
ncbi:MAG: hypothetical protein DRG20_02380 [Deltaproteobacteria bacterium]|nr:MAG: hypothetical protein DRG20_02380 [Deltaproteobacteria bacterium]